MASAHSISHSNGRFSEPLKAVFDHICILGGILTEQKMYEIIAKKADEMKDMALTILECRGDIGQLTRDVAVLKIQLDSMAAREAERLREERIS